MGNKEQKTVFCPFCMKEHSVSVMVDEDVVSFKGQDILFPSQYYYCEESQETWEDEALLSSNDIAMKDAYREQNGLLNSAQIISTRKKYGISQIVLARLLGWGEKTVTRYESHQVQDNAHDMILRRVGDDPVWFLDVITQHEDAFNGRQEYETAVACVLSAIRQEKDQYNIDLIHAEYAAVVENASPELYYPDLDKLIAAVNFIAHRVSNLFKVKLMKLLWYADFLSYKRYGHSITGQLYLAKPMGALPVAHNVIMELDGITYEEVLLPDLEVGYRFVPTIGIDTGILSEEDTSVLDTVIEKYGRYKTDRLVDAMHRELAFKETSQGEIISYSYAKELNIS